MRFTCPSCNKSYRLPPERLGASGRAQIHCPNCHVHVHVRAGQGDLLECHLVTDAAHGHDAAHAHAAHEPAHDHAPKPGQATWFVVIGREKQGPMTVDRVAQMLASGELTRQSLAWQKGLAAWMKIQDIDALRLVAQASQPAPVAAAPRPISTAQPAVRTTGSAPRPAPVPKPTAARTSQPVPPARPKVDRPMPAQRSEPALDEAGPTMEAQVPFFGNRTATNHGRKAGPDHSKVAADAHGAAFFGGGSDMGDIDLQMPDPNKHKPTKEEYQNLLQEFSVMFRLDKRSKRQKIAIGVVLGALVLGVIAFGIALKVDGDAKRELIRDSKTILAVFNLPYQTSVKVQLEEEDSQDAGDVAAAGGTDAADKKPAVEKSTSDLAAKLQRTLRAQKRRQAGTGGKVELQGSTAEQIAARAEADRLGKEALERALNTGSGPKREKVATGGIGTVQNVTDSQLERLCSQRYGVLRTCGNKVLYDGAPYKLAFTINLLGGVSGVRAMVDGKPDADLAACVRANFSSNFGQQETETDHTCSVE